MKRMHRGFTLIELAVAVAVFGVCLAWALPAAVGLARSVKVHNGAQALTGSLHLTRAEAAKRNMRVSMCTSNSGTACETTEGWHAGWIVFHDSNGNGLYDPGEHLVYREGRLAEGLSMTGNQPVSRYVSYTAFGRTRLVSGAFQAGTITVCAGSGADAKARQVIINNMGRARMEMAGAQVCGG